MTVNQSKKEDPRFWARWRKAGAVETMEDALLRESTMRERHRP